ncbi:zinc-binding dehydrogenase [Nocardia fusca]|uniref:zinc-binding dehydrogenase n=1 Tax=Nocardia fusca TaxID=941183 RepID=UPI0037CCBEF5
MQQLHLIRARRLSWRDVPDPVLREPTDVLVRPFVAARCDGDTLPIHRPVSRVMQLGLHTGHVDPVVAGICGRVPFQGPFAIGHECVAEVVEAGPDVSEFVVGDVVVVPWAVSCGECARCRRGLTAKCSTTAAGVLAAYGFGPASGGWGGMISDLVRVPYADHMLVKVPAGVDPLRVAAASDNLADAWRCVVSPLVERPGGSVLVLGGAAQSIGLYAAGLAVAHGAEVDYVDDDLDRLGIAEGLGARSHTVTARDIQRGRLPGRRYDIVVEASSSAAGVRAGLRALEPGGVCTPVGYYVAPGTKVPLMHMYANDITLHVGVSHVRPLLPDLLGFVARTGFAAEKVTTVLADWDQAPEAYRARTIKLVLQRPRLYAGRQ